MLQLIHGRVAIRPVCSGAAIFSNEPVPVRVIPGSLGRGRGVGDFVTKLLRNSPSLCTWLVSLHSGSSGPSFLRSCSSSQVWGVQARLLTPGCLHQCSGLQAVVCKRMNCWGNLVTRSVLSSPPHSAPVFRDSGWSVRVG